MILADKIIKLRKRSGWSQEDLAAKLNVSRQSVSKWESGLSIPDLDKIIKISKIFGVTTDYLIKDEIEEISPLSEDNYEIESYEGDNSVFVSLEEAGNYLSAERKSASWTALAIALCIFSPIPLIALVSAKSLFKNNLDEDQLGVIGIILLLFIISIAAGILIYFSSKMSKYDYLEKKSLKVEYGVAGLAEKGKESFSAQYTLSIISGVSLCILSSVPLLLGALLSAPYLNIILSVCGLLLMVSVAVFIIVRANIINDSFNKLLEEKDFSKENKLYANKYKHVFAFYWLATTAIYLFVSFLTDSWERSWIIWPVSGVAFAALSALLKGVFRKSRKDI